ncbi:MAG TPA: protein kinase [Bryobacteraceae bacterium]|nr:protein kinase [Bryobacteraceae bacterium]
MGPQQTIAHYRIIAKLGEGGMGEVYRATDTKLGREVALKILPESFAQDPERMARFEREAKVLASLNHPHIAQIHGIEERALVMELVEGKPLKGPLPLETALDYARQIADALEAAHEKGIVHRDLKPANILVGASGTVKLLDFGLAKAAAEDPVSNPQNSPTLTMSPTRAGVILGTAAYMAPEQARGKVVDKRADIWAFGVVLYEMLTGKHLFTGETISDILAGVLKTEPDLTRVPVQVRRLLAGCLQKDPKRRLQAIGDYALLLDAAAPETTAPSRSPLGIGVMAVLAISLIGVSWIAWRATRPVEHPLTRLSVDLGPEAVAGANSTVAISPDGRRIVYPTKTGLATRLLDQATPTLLAGTEGGSDAFFSPDGQWIGFFAGGQLKKISVQGGAPVTLCAALNGRGASWGDDGNIVATLSIVAPLSLVPAGGGAPKPLTKLASGEATHRWPQVLPGGKEVLFTASTFTGQENANVEAVSLRTGLVTVLVRGGYFGRYLPTGHLVYVHQGVLFGVPFDVSRLKVRGTPTPLVEDLAAGPNTGGGQFAFSRNGTLVYLAGKSSAQTARMEWLDGSGKPQPLLATPGVYLNPRFSPDGKKLAYETGSDIYIYDLERDTTTRLTFIGNANGPVWSPDGRHIVFEASAKNLLWVRSDGAGEPQRLVENLSNPVPGSFSPDGRRLAYFPQAPATGWDLWTLPLDLSDPDHPKAGQPELFLGTTANELLPRFSPDGRWIAYRSNESGTDEIYVRPFPAGSGGKWQISSGGGLFALWSPNGRELFYETADNRIMVTDYRANGDSFAPDKPRRWSDQQLFNPGRSNLDLAPDGKRFAVLVAPETAGGEKGSVHVTMLLNFFDEVKRRIP